MHLPVYILLLIILGLTIWILVKTVHPSRGVSYSDEETSSGTQACYNACEKKCGKSTICLLNCISACT